MNFFVLFLFSLYRYVLVSGEEPQPPTLISRWDLIEPDIFYCEDGADFVFRYGMSDLIEDDMVEFELFRSGCEINIWSNNYLVPTVVKDLAPLGDGWKVRQMLVALQPNINLLAVSPVYSVSEDGSTGTIAFCIKMSIYTKDKQTLVNYKEIEYAQDTIIKADVRKLEVSTKSILEESSSSFRRRLSLDCSNGFDVLFENWWSTDINPFDSQQEEFINITNESDFSIVVASKKALNMGNDTGLDVEDWSFLLIAYHCDENNIELTTTTAFNQGDTIRICIEPDQEAKDTGLVMKQIDTAYFTRDDIPSIYQYAVEDGQPDFYGMSEIFCVPGSVKCAVETTIRSEFFASSGMIKASGAATFQWEWESVGRQLHGKNERESERELQEQEPGIDSIGRFILSVPIKTFQETLDIKMNNGPSYLQSFLLIVLSFTFIVATSILLWIRDFRRLGALSEIPSKRNLTETSRTESFCYDDDDD